MKIRLIATFAMGVIAALIVGVFFFANRQNHPQSNAQLPVVSAARIGATPLAPSCTAFTFKLDKPTVPVAVIRGLRVSSADVAIQFMNGAPSGRIDIRPQTGTKFTVSRVGIAITLGGSNGILVSIHGADLHSAYSGPTDIWNDGPNLVEVRRLQDLEGVVQLALGINGPACYSVAYETYVGGSSLHLTIPVSAPLLATPDPSRLTASKCSGPAPGTAQRQFGNYTLRFSPDWVDTGNDRPTESRALELAAPAAYGNRPILFQLHQFPIEVATSFGSAATAHSIAAKMAASHPLMSDKAVASAIADCTVGRETAAVFGYADGGQVGFWVWMVHKDLLHGIRLVGAGGISDQAIQDALGMMGSIGWTF